MGSVAARAFALGVAAGLRSMTPPAVVSRAARDGTLDLRDTGFAFMASDAAAVILGAMAAGELAADKTATIPNRTDPGPLAGRIVSGGLCGACLSAADNEAAAVGAVFGAIGAAIGTFGGYRVRTGLVKALHVPDAVIAVPEDLLATTLARSAVGDAE